MGEGLELKMAGFDSCGWDFKEIFVVCWKEKKGGYH
jgi:hypothetical protein